MSFHYIIAKFLLAAWGNILTMKILLEGWGLQLTVVCSVSMCEVPCSIPSTSGEKERATFGMCIPNSQETHTIKCISPCVIYIELYVGEECTDLSYQYVG